MVEILRLSPNSIDNIANEIGLPFEVRHATEADISQLIPLITSAYIYENEGEGAFKKKEAVRANRQSLAQAMEEGALLMASKLQDGKERIVGCMQYKEITPSEGSGSGQATNAYFGMLAVEQEGQGQGIGRSLVGFAEALAASRGRDLVEIQVVDHSAHLLDWYGRLGYAEFARKNWDAPFLTRPSQFVLMKKRIQEGQER